MVSSKLQTAADIFTCAAGDFKSVHWNVRGPEFDVMHEVAQHYYEEAAKDADELSEWTAAHEGIALNPNDASSRISWPTDSKTYTRDAAVAKFTDVITTLVATLETLLDEGTAIANLAATRSEFWTKELSYFNKSREPTQQGGSSLGGSSL